MNATNLSAKSHNPRLNRIKIVSRIFRLVILLSFALPAFIALTVHFGWVGVIPGVTSLQLSPHQIYKWPFDGIPSPVLALALVRLALVGLCGLILNNLFRLYGHGIFFTTKNVNYIQFLGCYLIIDALVVFQLDALALHLEVTLVKPLIGLLIIFIAWIMDEGRKIQEEQELTV